MKKKYYATLVLLLALAATGVQAGLPVWLNNKSLTRIIAWGQEKRLRPENEAKQRTAKKPSSLREREEAEEDEAEGGELAEWMYRMRAYPNEELPLNGHQLAWEEAQLLPIVFPQGNGISIQSTNWEFWGPDATNVGWTARTNAVVPHPTNANILYIGVSQGGLWKSADAGATWTNLTDSLSSQVIGCVTLDPTNPNIIYIGTGEEAPSGPDTGAVGIWKSPDGGQTWTLKGNSTFANKRINEVVIDPNNTNHWIVSCTNLFPHTAGGIYTTTDGGSTFTQRLQGNTSALRMNPTNANILYAAISRNQGNPNSKGVYKSTDGGNTWAQQTANGLPTGANVGRTKIDFCKSNPNVVYVAFSDDARLTSVWKTTNDGASWAQTAMPNTDDGQFAQAFWNMMLRVDPNNPNIAFVGTLYHSRTQDGGASWQDVFQSGHTDQQAMAFHPTDPVKLYYANDGGLFRVDVAFPDASFTFPTALNTGRGTMEFYALDVHPTDPNKLAGGTQDNGPHLRFTNNTYTRQLGGDGIAAAYNHSSPNTILMSVVRGTTYRSTDGGNNFGSPVFSQSIANDFTASAVAPLINDPNVGTRFYTATTKVYRSNSDGDAGTWSAISGSLTNNTPGYALHVIAVAPSDSNTVYTGSEDGAVYVSTNAGGGSPTWTNRSAGLPSAPIGGIAVDPGNNQKVYVGLSGYNTSRVMMSTNAGATWTNISGNLPNSPVNSLAVASNNANVLYAATDVGVFITTDGGATWARYGDGLPSSQCMMLRANATTGYLTVATYGRGMWRIPLYTNSPVPTLTSLNPTVRAAGSGAFTLTVNGTNFLNNSVVRWNGSDRTTTYGSATQLTASITAADVQNAGTATVKVFNPGGGGESNGLTFTIAAVPTLTNLNPSTKAAGSGAFTLTVNGTNFINTSVVRWNGSDRTTTYGSGTQVTASITTADVQNAGTATVKVFNPGGGGESNGLTFNITQPNTAPVAGLAGAALALDGTDDVVTIPHNAIQNAYPMTISCWIKTSQSNFTRVGVINKYVSSSGNGWQLYLYNGKVAAYYFGNGYIYDGDDFTTPSIADNAWHHIALTIDASGGKLYKDGVLVDTQAWAGTPGAPTTTTPLKLGQYDGYLNGQLDEVKIFNVAHTAAHIQFDMTSSLRGDEPGLIAYYRLNEGTGSTATDATSNGNNGTLSGSPAWVASGAGVNAIGAQPNTPRPVTLSAFDAELNSLTYSIVSNPTKGSLSGTPPSSTYNPGLSYYGADSFTYKANDGSVDSNTATVNVNYGMPGVNVAGTTTGQPTYHRTSEGSPPTTLSSGGTAVRYKTYRLIVPTSGYYNIIVTQKTAGYDPFVTLYYNSFNPSSPLTNVLYANDDKGDVNYSGWENVYLSAGTHYYVVVSGYDNNDFGDFNLAVMGVDTPSVIDPSTLRTLSGSVSLEDCPGRAFTAGFYLLSEDNERIIRIVDIPANGSFTLDDLPAKHFAVAVKTFNTLTRLASVDLTNGNGSVDFAPLKGGDADGDNLVSVEDLGILIASFDADSSSPNWMNGLADFNCDGLISVDDLDILIRNFDQSGEGS